MNGPIEHRPWFPAKKYGWGWGPPVTWQGWVVLWSWVAAYTAGMVIVVVPLIVRHRPAAAIVAGAGVSVVMILVITAICWWKGERPRWRWGD